MKNTLADRLKDAMTGPPKVTGRALAAACGIKPPSVSDWLNGVTKSLDAANLIHAAEFLKVNPKWLALGLGLKYAATLNLEPKAAQQLPIYIADRPQDLWTLEAIAIMQKLQPAQREGAVAVLRTYVTHLGPPSVGQAVFVAG